MIMRGYYIYIQYLFSFSVGDTITSDFVNPYQLSAEDTDNDDDDANSLSGSYSQLNFTGSTENISPSSTLLNQLKASPELGFGSYSDSEDQRPKSIGSRRSLSRKSGLTRKMAMSGNEKNRLKRSRDRARSRSGSRGASSGNHNISPISSMEPSEARVESTVHPITSSVPSIKIRKPSIQQGPESLPSRLISSPDSDGDLTTNRQKIIVQQAASSFDSDIMEIGTSTSAVMMNIDPEESINTLNMAKFRKRSESPASSPERVPAQSKSPIPAPRPRSRNQQEPEKKIDEVFDEFKKVLSPQSHAEDMPSPWDEFKKVSSVASHPETKVKSSPINEATIMESGSKKTTSSPSENSHVPEGQNSKLSSLTGTSSNANELVKGPSPAKEQRKPVAAARKRFLPNIPQEKQALSGGSELNPNSRDKMLGNIGKQGSNVSNASSVLSEMSTTSIDKDHTDGLTSPTSIASTDSADSISKSTEVITSPTTLNQPQRTFTRRNATRVSRRHLHPQPRSDEEDKEKEQSAEGDFGDENPRFRARSGAVNRPTRMQRGRGVGGVGSLGNRVPPSTLEMPSEEEHDRRGPRTRTSIATARDRALASTARRTTKKEAMDISAEDIARYGPRGRKNDGEN